MNFINAKFKSKCTETGALYEVQQEADGTSSYIVTQENAYYDNFCLANNI
jgi:hypothetical protein